jgi:glutamate--cysteine ligase
MTNMDSTMKGNQSVLADLLVSGLNPSHIPYVNRGLEKETLRQTPNGQLSQLPHPEKFGSALTHRYITTDYSEALVEFITPVFKSTKDLLDFLMDIHSFAAQNLPEGESFWCHSMPCILSEEKDIPLATYGSSNIGMMKHVYRRGLDWRYTRRMQTIAGVHYNFSYPESLWSFLHQQKGSSLSLQDFISEQYFGLIRNFQRYVWLLFYFTGSSPALCKSFLTGKNHTLESFDKCTAYLPWSTSLRMSDLGYTNKDQQSLNVSFNSPEEYISSLRKAIETPSAEFEKIGIKVDGEYRQLNSNILQIENEFYSIIRPKRTAHSGEKPTTALKKRGVEYIEVRMLDVNPFEATGISAETINFIDIFMLACLLNPSPAIDDKERKIIKENQTSAINNGRNPELLLQTVDGPQSFTSLATEMLDNLKDVASFLQGCFPETPYLDTLQKNRDMIGKPELTPAGKVLNEMKKGECSYYPFAKNISAKHNQSFSNHKLPEELMTHFSEEASRSLQTQREIEKNDQTSFDEFLDEYFARD